MSAEPTIFFAFLLWFCCSCEEVSQAIFNTAFFTILAFVIFFIPISIIVAWFAPDFFNIPDIERFNVFLLFCMVFFSSLVTSIQAPYNAILFSFNKIHYVNYISIFKILFVPFVIVSLFYFSTPSVIHVGIATLLSALFSLFFTILLSKKTYDKIDLSIIFFSKDQLKKISELTKWILVDQIGTLLLFSLSLIIVNKEYGTTAGGEYAIVLMFFNLLWNITGLITSVLSPMYYTYFAREMFSSIHRLSIVTVKCIGLVMALPIALICIFSPQLLTIWVGEEFSHLSTIIWILLIPLTMIIGFRPLVLCYTAYNQVRIPAYATIFFGLLNLVLAIVLSETFSLGLYGIAIAFILALWLRFVVFVPWYTGKVQGVSSFLFYRSILPGSIAFIILIIIGFILVSLLAIPASIMIIALISSLISLIYCLSVFRLLLTSQDRNLIRTIIPSIVSNKIPTWLL